MLHLPTNGANDLLTNRILGFIIYVEYKSRCGRKNNDG